MRLLAFRFWLYRVEVAGARGFVERGSCSDGVGVAPERRQAQQVPRAPPVRCRHLTRPQAPAKKGKTTS